MHAVHRAVHRVPPHALKNLPLRHLPIAHAVERETLTRRRFHALSRRSRQVTARASGCARALDVPGINLSRAFGGRMRTSTRAVSEDEATTSADMTRVVASRRSRVAGSSRARCDDPRATDDRAETSARDREGDEMDASPRGTREGS